jgi:hypothetical protein
MLSLNVRTYREREREREIQQTRRHADTQTHRQTNTHTDTQTHRHTDTQTHTLSHLCIVVNTSHQHCFVVRLLPRINLPEIYVIDR